MNLANIPTAREMGTKLGSLSRLLFREKLIQSNLVARILLMKSVKDSKPSNWQNHGDTLSMNQSL